MDLSLTVQSGGPTPAGAVLRSTQAYRELVCAKTTLDGGIAFHCERFPQAAQENEFREVWTPRPEDAAQTIAAAESFYAEHGLRCTRWALAEAQKPEMLDALLQAAGWVRDDAWAMVLAEWLVPAATPVVRVLPARPMRAAYAACWAEQAEDLPTQEEREAAVEVANERLDDHRLDAFVAMVDKQPAGTVALFQVGDIGQVVGLNVNRSFRDGIVGSALVGHVLTLARRLALRIVVASWPQRDTAGRALLERHGFAEAARLVEYRRAGEPQAPVADAW